MPEAGRRPVAITKFGPPSGRAAPILRAAWLDPESRGGVEQAGSEEEERAWRRCDRRSRPTDLRGGGSQRGGGGTGGFSRKTRCAARSPSARSGGDLTFKR